MLGSSEFFFACQASSISFITGLRKKSVGDLNIQSGFVGNVAVSVLRDTGCSIIGVRKSLISEDQYIEGTYTLKLVDGQIFKYPLARITIDTPYLTGTYIAALFDDPVADIIIGNVEEARNVHFASAVTRAMEKKQLTPVVMDNVLLDFNKISNGCDEFETEQTNDNTLVHLWERVKIDSVDIKKKGLVSFKTKDGLLYRHFQHCSQSENVEQLVVPQSKRSLVLENAHVSPFAGHMSVNKTRARVYSTFYWPGADRDIKHFVRTCPVCQKARAPGRSGRAELGVMNLVTTPFLKVAIDIVGPLELTDRRNRYILTMVDMATRWPEAVALPNVTTETIIEALSNIFSRIGFPEEILSDNGPQFKSEMYEQVCRFFNTRVLKTTPYHPSSNGLVERFNGSLKNMLMRLAEKETRNWDRFVSAALFAYREVPNVSTGMSPYEMVYGRRVRGPMSILKNLFTNKFIEQETKQVYEYLLDLRNRLRIGSEIAQNNDNESKKIYKKYYDRYCINKKIEEGDHVLLLKPHKENKLALYWDGPYVVEKRNSQFNYTVRKGDKMKMYHINRLLRYHDRSKVIGDRPKTDVVLSAGLASVINETDDDDNSDGIEAIPTLEMTGVSGELGKVKINKELSVVQIDQINSILNTFKEIISDIPGKAKVEEFKIELTSDKPVTLKPYTVPLHMQDTLKKEIESMLELGIIEESDSPYASPVVLVKKKDSTVRPCVDYRRLNAITRFDADVIPDQEDLFVQLNKAIFFTKIDLTKGFWQLPIEVDSRQYTAFRVPNGHYQFKFVPFGLLNSPSYFNRTIRKVLKGLNHVVFYFDDILIFNDVWDSHLDAVTKVFQRLKEVGLTVKPEKLEIAFRKVKFLGHVVGGGKMEPDPANIEKIMGLKIPTNKKEVRALLGLANYYSKFIPSFADLVFPLTRLLGKGMPTRVVWSYDCDITLRKIQAYLSHYPILLLPNPDEPFILQTDASDKGISCCLMQKVNGKLHPVKYLSRKLLPREQRYAIIERECLAIVWSVQRLARYLCGTSFTIQCDHRPLSYLRTSHFQNSRLCRWLLILQEYNFNIVHIKGKENVFADVLSRLV